MSRNEEFNTGYLNRRALPYYSGDPKFFLSSSQAQHMDFQNSDKMTERKFNTGKTGGNGNDFRLHDNLAG